MTPRTTSPLQWVVDCYKASEAGLGAAVDLGLTPVAGVNGASSIRAPRSFVSAKNGNSFSLADASARVFCSQNRMKRRVWNAAWTGRAGAYRPETLLTDP